MKKPAFDLALRSGGPGGPAGARGAGPVRRAGRLAVAAGLFAGLCAAGVALAIPPPAPPMPAPPPSSSPPTGAKPAAPKPAARPAAPKPSAAPKPPAAPVRTAKNEPPPCQPGDAAVALLPVDADLTCNEQFQECQGEITLTARNCTSEFQMFTKVEFFENGRRSQVLEFSPALIAQPGGLWREHLPVTETAEMEAVLYFHPPGVDAENSQSARGPVKVINRTLDKAKAACDACQGTWGKFGVNKYEACNCKTKDAGKVCNDGDECEGYCVFKRYDGEGREEGLCSETQRLTGCMGIVWKGQSKYPPRLPPPRKTTTCLD